MDGDKDNKSIVEKAVDAVKGFATSISEAAQRTAEPAPPRSDDEIMMTPVAAGGLMDETVAPQLVVRRRPIKPPSKVRARASKAKASKKAAKKRSAKKPLKQTSRKSAKKAKARKGQKAVGKTAKKKKKAKTSRT